MPLATSHMGALPLLITAGGTIVTLLIAAFARQRRPALLAAAATLALALLSLGPAAAHAPAAYTDLLFLDGLSILAMGLVLFASLCVLLLADPYLDRRDLPAGEFSLLLLPGVLGGLIVVASSHFASLFLGIELLGIPLVALAAFHRERAGGLEAGFKYLILAGISSALLLFGIALLYAATGDLSYGSLLGRPSPLRQLGLTLVVSGMAFKLALVPFHFWAPDVYDGAPAPVTAFAATAVKAAVFVALLRLLPPAQVVQDRFLFIFFALLSVASMTLGNIAALRQRNLKRMLAYSSIAHNGYLLVAFLSAGASANTSVLLFLVSYVVTNLGAFGVVALLSHADRDADELVEYTGLSWRQPVMASVLTLSVLSLLGLPLTAGFIAKFSLVAAGMQAEQIALVLALVINTALSAYYYIRVVMTLFLGSDEVPAQYARHLPHRPPVTGAIVLLLQALLVLVIGISPQAVIRLIQRMLG